MSAPVTIHTEPVSEQVSVIWYLSSPCGLAAVIPQSPSKLRDSLLLLCANTGDVVMCRIPGNPKFCLGTRGSQCRSMAQALQTDCSCCSTWSEGDGLWVGFRQALPA